MKLKIGLIIIGTLFLSSCMMMSPALMSGSMHQGQNLELSGLRMDPVCGKYVGEENNYLKIENSNFLFLPFKAHTTSKFKKKKIVKIN